MLVHLDSIAVQVQVLDFGFCTALADCCPRLQSFYVHGALATSIVLTAETCQIFAVFVNLTFFETTLVICLEGVFSLLTALPATLTTLKMKANLDSRSIDLLDQKFRNLEILSLGFKGSLTQVVF